MALDKITNKNFLSKGAPFLKVYSGWYNVLVDALNAFTDYGFGMTTGGGIENNADGIIPHLPIATAPSTHHVFFDDFVLSAASAAPAAEWTVTEDDAADTQLLIDAAGGVLQLTCKAATDNDGHQIQLQQETFRLASGKSIWYEARIRLPEADVTNIDFAIGLAVTEDLTGVADNMPANGIVFTKTDAGVGTVFLSSSDNGTNIISAASLKTLVTNTWTRLGFYVNGGATGLATVTPYIDGVAGQPITAVTYGTMSELAPIVMVRNGDGVTTQVLDIDYVHVVQIR